VHLTKFGQNQTFELKDSNISRSFEKYRSFSNYCRIVKTRFVYCPSEFPKIFSYLLRNKENLYKVYENERSKNSTTENRQLKSLMAFQGASVLFKQHLTEEVKQANIIISETPC